MLFRSSQKDHRGSDLGGGRKRERSSVSSRSDSRQSTRTDGYPLDPQRQSMERNSKTSRWGDAESNQDQGRKYVSHVSWSFDTSKPPPNLQQNQWINREQDRNRQGNRGGGSRFNDVRKDWNRGRSEGHIRRQTANTQEDRSRGYWDNNQNNRYSQSRSDYSSNSNNAQPSRRYSGDSNQYGYNSSNNGGDYYDHDHYQSNEFGDHQGQYPGASSGNHHQFSETYDEQGDRFNYNDGYDSHSFASEKDHQQRPGSSSDNLRRLPGGQADGGDQSLRPGRYLLVTWDTEILPGGGLYQLAALSSHGDSLHCVVEQRGREEDLHQAKHHPNFPLVILSGHSCRLIFITAVVTVLINVLIV